MDYRKEMASLSRYSSRYLDEKEAAYLLGLKPQTLANWRSLRRGPAYSRLGVGGSIRYRFEDLLRFAEAGRIEPER
jgi:hypothetical protein